MSLYCRFYFSLLNHIVAPNSRLGHSRFDERGVGCCGVLGEVLSRIGRPHSPSRSHCPVGTNSCLVRDNCTHTQREREGERKIEGGERERERVCVCVCEREREREKERKSVRSSNMHTQAIGIATSFMGLEGHLSPSDSANPFRCTHFPRQTQWSELVVLQIPLDCKTPF